ncbi:MAG: exosortase system-associated protein, TIGR04073 family [Candidatus Omnitrophica bacterium]|nr:exosortase system-associated protein, TIGR04073 family [Candidatus Omnitrophota bacterium]
MRVKLLVLVLITAVALVSCPQAWALGAEVDTGALVVTKLFRGIVNAATGWIEIPKHVSLTWQASGPGVGMTWGLVKGLGFAVARSVAGGYEIATFPMPIPEGYRPIMHPEYVLSDLPGSSQPSR